MYGKVPTLGWLLDIPYMAYQGVFETLVKGQCVSWIDHPGETVVVTMGR